MRHRFALTEEGRVVGIDELGRDTRHSFGPLACPGCGHPFVAALGEKVVHHFRHKCEDAASECRPETYLHRTAKLIIADTFRSARRQANRYLIEGERRVVCPAAKRRALGPCRTNGDPPQLDLAATFRTVTPEVGRHGLVFDLLFEGPGRTLAMEIAVTHRMSRDKAAVGLPIIEISIESEDNLHQLRTKIDMQRLAWRTANVSDFEPGEIPACAGQACRSQVVEFLVYASGKTRLRRCKPHDVSDPERQPIIHQEVHRSQAAGRLGDFEILDRLTRRAFYTRSVRLRSCLVCRHHDLSGGAVAGGPVYCRSRGSAGPINAAAACSAFSPFPHADDVRALRAAQHPGLVEDEH